MTLNVSPGSYEGDSIFCVRDMFPSMPLDRVVGRAKDWLTDIESLRAGSSNLQGLVSRRMRDRVSGVEAAVNVLSSRAEDATGTSFLQPHNEELER